MVKGTLRRCKTDPDCHFWAGPEFVKISIYQCLKVQGCGHSLKNSSLISPINSWLHVCHTNIVHPMKSNLTKILHFSEKDQSPFLDRWHYASWVGWVVVGRPWCWRNAKKTDQKQNSLISLRRSSANISFWLVLSVFACFCKKNRS